MDYPYENLDDERFQQLAQALIVKEHKNVQCFPVGQPDGGRDAITYYKFNSEKNFIIYQVKFVRNPNKIEDIFKWLKTTLELELPKLPRQIKDGARQYILVTNLQGSAHLDTGSIDKLNNFLNNILSIPSICWWRNDLSRRLDNAYDLKWIYHELMTGSDLIRAIIENSLGETSQRRSNTLRAYLRDQYEKDKEVRFKQVELQNNLLDLYIDVPILPSIQQEDESNHSKLKYVLNKVYRDYSKKIGDNSQSVYLDGIDYFYHENLHDISNLPEDKLLGAAIFLTNSNVRKHFPKIVLEGAPGQGKSTVTQFIAQVNRIKILKRNTFYPEIFKEQATAIPFKIDLRDFATWVSKQNPFIPDDTDFLKNWSKSLESFLAAHIRFYSGGAEFSVDDLLIIGKVSSLLLIFDGLDEVPDISSRKEVIDEIIKGTVRLEENVANLQVIVTSRPAAFANSPGFPRGKYQYFQLGSVTKKLVMEYTEKWLNARKLTGRAASDVRIIVKDKLDQPHIRDLARNTMQLTILLSLVNSKGVSLPDKRTSLYFQYVDLFFNREAEKSEVVREYRDLLVNIHQYLAWKLHSDSERGQKLGSINEIDLQRLLVEYLINESYDSGLAKTLFSSMVERVVAIVSRVEGTYEFEVQPLREYFAAKYLYETAPYSPAGNEQKGTKPDRFNAIARNFYWLNVTRFYAGCYSKGELGSLIYSIDDLVNDKEFNAVGYPLRLASILLSDWVFTQEPRSAQQLINIIFETKAIWQIVDPWTIQKSFFGNLILSDTNGRKELLKKCFEELSLICKDDLAKLYINLIKSNSQGIEIEDLWEKFIYINLYETNKDYVIFSANELGVFHTISVEKIYSFFDDQLHSKYFIYLLLKSKRFDIIHADIDVFNISLDLALDRKYRLNVGESSISPIEDVFEVFNLHRYLFSNFPKTFNLSLNSAWNRFRNFANFSNSNNEIEEVYLRIQSLVDVSKQSSNYVLDDWINRIDPWNVLIEGLRGASGDRWALFCLVNLAPYVNTNSTEQYDLFDERIPLFERVNFAKSKYNSPKWWLYQSEKLNSSYEKEFFLLICLSWGSMQVLGQMVKIIDSFVNELEDEKFKSLYQSTLEYILITDKKLNKPKFIKKNISEISHKALVILSVRFTPELKCEILDEKVCMYEEEDKLILQFIADNATRKLYIEDIDKGKFLSLIKSCYMHNVCAYTQSYRSPFNMNMYYNKNGMGLKLPYSDLMFISANKHEYPILLIKTVEKELLYYLEKNVKPVADTAYEDGWFSY